MAGTKEQVVGRALFALAILMILALLVAGVTTIRACHARGGNAVVGAMPGSIVCVATEVP